MEEKAYKYLVGVRCFTFNHSKYILDALNGFVMQETNFPYVVMVVDDASTDGEQEVIRKFVTEQFDIADNSVAYKKETDYAHITYAKHKTNENCYIAVLYLKENHYSQRKSKMPYLAEWRDHVKYEALCEGDDYWIDAQKLQKQVDFLEEHEEYVMCHTSVDYFYENVHRVINYRDIEINTPLNNNGIVSIEDTLTKYRIQYCSVLYRKDIYEQIINSDKMLYKGGYFLMGDTQLWFGFARIGKIHFEPSVMAIYRKNVNSATTQKDLRKRKRFSLSMTEMRYYISLHYDIKEEIKKEFKQNYEKALIIYWKYEPSFVPKFPIEIENKKIKTLKYRLENFVFNIMQKLLAKPRKMFQKSI